VSTVADVVLDGILLHCKGALSLLERIPSLGLVLASLDPLEASWVRLATLRYFGPIAQFSYDTQWAMAYFDETVLARRLLLRLQSRLVSIEVTVSSKESFKSIEALLSVYDTLLQYADTSI